MEELGNKIRQKRTELGYTARDVAQRVGVSGAYYSRIENGSARPSLSTLGSLSLLFNLGTAEQRSFYELAGFTTGPTEESKGVSRQDKDSEVEYKPNYSSSIQPILYADIMYFAGSENGVVIEFGQKGGASEVNIVARVGLSLKHAKKIQEMLKTELVKLPD